MNVPDWCHANPTAITITALGTLLILWRSWSPLRTVGLCAGIDLIIGIAKLVQA